VADLKEKLKGEDTAAIREATEKVAATSQTRGQALYADAQASGAAEGAAGPQDAGAGAQGADDDVVDAEIVDDEKKDGAA
jgi:molecular chaperone DnaK